MAHFDTKYHYLLKKKIPPPKKLLKKNSRTLQSYVMLKIVMETIAFWGQFLTIIIFWGPLIGFIP